MRIIGFNLTKISIQREEKPKDKLEINQNINIKDIKEEPIPISDDKALKMTFALSIEYSNDFAKIEFEGSVLILPDKDESKKFLDSWKDKKIPENVRVPLFNFIMNKFAPLFCCFSKLFIRANINYWFHYIKFNTVA